MRSVSIPSLLACLSVFVHRSAADGGFFFALDRADQDDRVYRIDVNDDFSISAVTPIGAPGAIGFPKVCGIVWDWEHERLHGYDKLLSVWLEINVSTGVATELGPFTHILFDMTYDPNNDMVYGVVGTGNLLEIDPTSGESNIVAEGVSSEALSHVLDTTGGLDGFFTGISGLRLIVESSFQMLDFGGSGGGRQEFE